MSHDNTISILGYRNRVDYGENHNLPYVTQCIFDFGTGKKEIAFYNTTANQTYNNWNSAVAIWRIKQRH